MKTVTASFLGTASHSFYMDVSSVIGEKLLYTLFYIFKCSYFTLTHFKWLKYELMLDISKYIYNNNNKQFK
jgi:hypothetical protein